MLLLLVPLLIVNKTDHRHNLSHCHSRYFLVVIVAVVVAVAAAVGVVVVVAVAAAVGVVVVVAAAAACALAVLVLAVVVFLVTVVHNIQRLFLEASRPEMHPKTSCTGQDSQTGAQLWATSCTYPYGVAQQVRWWET